MNLTLALKASKKIKKITFKKHLCFLIFLKINRAKI